jgi:hypothetical protein
MRSEKMMY